MLTLLDPKVISESKDIIDDLAKFGIDHRNKSPDLGWSYVLEHVWLTEQIEKYLVSKNKKDMVILDVGCGRSPLHNFLERKFGIKIIGVDRPQGYSNRPKSLNVDYYTDFLKMKEFPEKSVDIIYWLSAIEHNQKDDIKKLYQKSMSILKDGGLFLATIPVSENTHWFTASEQTNLSIVDCKDIFQIDDIQGDFYDIMEKFRQNYLFLKDKYQRRYKKFDQDDPQFIVGAVSKIKARAGAKCLSAVPAQPEDAVDAPIYLFQPSNDTHVHLMYPLSKLLKGSVFMIHPGKRKNERADQTLEKLGEWFYSYQPGLLSQIKPDVIVFACDWGGQEKEIIAEAKKLGIPTVCIQEGCLDFIDQKTNRMLHADFAFMQGPIMQKFIRRTENIFVTGNPKYDPLHEMPLPSKPMVMINCNFTYNIHEDARDQWVKDVVEVCRDLNLDFFVSQHPRDKGVFPADYNVIRSDAFKMYKQLESSSILVSRFSTCIYEALMLGRESVYYNPHNEIFRIFAQDDTGGIWLAKNRDELADSLSLAFLNLGKNKTNRDKFLQQHCTTLNHDATAMCVQKLTEIAQNHKMRAQAAAENILPTAQGENAPTVSVIIPSYNSAKYLPDAVNSVLSQTFTDFEIVIVDDGSTDNTAEVVKSFNDKRIKYIYQQNKGAAAARNNGIKNSRGKYITFLDADDYFLPDKLKNQVQFLDSYPDYGLVGGTFLRVDENCNGIKNSAGHNRPVLLAKLFERNRFAVHAILVRRQWLELAGGFDETQKAAEDWDLYCRMAKAGCLMYQTDESVCAYRFVNDSLSADQTDNMLQVTGKTFSSAGSDSKLSDVEQKSNGYVHLRAAFYSYAANLPEKGRFHFEQALMYCPNFCFNDYEEIISLMVSWADHLNIGSPEKFFQLVLDNLPRQAAPMRMSYNDLVYRTISNRLLCSYKNKHQGQRCFIINNGPVLDKIDLSALKNEITFGLDEIYYWSEKTGFNPTYYLCLDPVAIDRGLDRIFKIPSTKFFNSVILSYLNVPENTIFLGCGGLKFSKDPYGGLGDGYSSVYFAMQLAFFMGFSEVVLVGQPHQLLSENERKYENSVGLSIHFDLHYVGESRRENWDYADRVAISYKMAACNFNSDGRRIIDATVNSDLDIFPRADYQQILTGNYQAISLGQKSRQSIWFEPGGTPQPDSLKNFCDIADSYYSMGQYQIAEKLYEKIIEPLKKAVNGIDLAACQDFKDGTELAEHFFGISTRLAQCYYDRKAIEKTVHVYLDVITAKYLTIPENHRQEMIDVLKKCKALPPNFDEVNSNRQDLQILQSEQNEQSPLVTVIMPAYNAEKYIEKAVESVLSQTFRNFELIIINDGSTDKTDGIVSTFKDPRIKYFKQSNKGLPATHNEGIRKSRGRFVIKLDSDDLMTQDFIEKHLQVFNNNPDVDLVYCDDVLIDQDGKVERIITRREYSDRKLLIRDLFRAGFPVIPFRTCIKKTVFDKIGFFEETLKMAEDYDMIRRFVKQGLKMKHLPLPLYHRRLTHSSLSRSFNDDKAQSHFEVVRRFLDTFEPEELYPELDWTKITPKLRQFQLQCLAASTFAEIGNSYIRTNVPAYVKSAYKQARSQLEYCLKVAPNNARIQDIARQCEMVVSKFQDSGKFLSIS